MQTGYIDVNGYWGIILCYDLHRLDENEMRQAMMEFGMQGENIDKAIEILLFQKNTGMCISRPDIKMSLVFIGNATRNEQWWDSVAHETDHIQDAVCRYYDVSPGTEDAAYLQGYIMRGIVRVITKGR